MKFKIEIMGSSINHPIVAALKAWVENQGESISATLLYSRQDPSSGDILFLISCSELIGSEIGDGYRHVVVLRASDLPDGRERSPHIWSIIRCQDSISVSALSAEDVVDSGDIWAKKTVGIDKHVRSIRPGYGLAPKHIDAVIGSTSLEEIQRGQAMQWDSIEKMA